MRAIRFHETGGPDVLRLDDLPMPEPGPGEVRMKVEAIGLNRADLLVRQGRYLTQPPLPSGLGAEAAGVVDAVGAGVSDFAVGDQVMLGPFVQNGDRPVYAEEVVVPAAWLLRTPAGLDAVGPALQQEGAALWPEHVEAADAIDGWKNRMVTVPMRSGSTTFAGQPYLLHWALPNFFFHLATAHGILRRNGVDLGKRDFLGAF